jgi:DNA-binding CsgD family transcriptional regulator
MRSLPWEEINALVLEAGAEPYRRGLELWFLAGLPALIPNEAGVGVYDAFARCLRHNLWPDNLVGEYNERFRQHIPWVTFDSARQVRRGTDIVRLADYPRSVFLNEFARPNNMYHGLNPYRPGFRYNLAVQRSRTEPRFGARDCAILDIVNGHFNNLLAIHDRPGGAALKPLPPEIVREALPGLTRREAESLSWAAAGLTIAETATRLFVSPRTVEVHLQHAREKLGVRTTRLASRLLLERCRPD